MNFLSNKKLIRQFRVIAKNLIAYNSINNREYKKILLTLFHSPTRHAVVNAPAFSPHPPP